MNRRGFLGAVLGGLAAPAVVKAENLMRIVVPSNDIVTFDYTWTLNGKPIQPGWYRADRIHLNQQGAKALAGHMSRILTWEKFYANNQTIQTAIASGGEDARRLQHSERVLTRV